MPPTGVSVGKAQQSNLGPDWVSAFRRMRTMISCHFDSQRERALLSFKELIVVVLLWFGTFQGDRGIWLSSCN